MVCAEVRHEACFDEADAPARVRRHSPCSRSGWYGVDRNSNMKLSRPFPHPVRQSPEFLNHATTGRHSRRSRGRRRRPEYRPPRRVHRGWCQGSMNRSGWGIRPKIRPGRVAEARDGPRRAVGVRRDKPSVGRPSRVGVPQHDLSGRVERRRGPRSSASTNRPSPCATGSSIGAGVR